MCRFIRSIHYMNVMKQKPWFRMMYSSSVLIQFDGLQIYSMNLNTDSIDDNSFYKPIPIHPNGTLSGITRRRKSVLKC